VTSISIKDQHPSLSLCLFICIIIEVDKIFYNKTFIRISRETRSKKGVVFEVVFEVLLK